MRLKGSCYCQAVKFEVESSHPYPYQKCYCSICRKSQGGGGFSINLSGEAKSLKVTGEKNVKFFQAVIDGERSSGKRHFCSECGSALWLFDPTWPELVHPFASSIDSELPKALEETHILLDFKKQWVKPCVQIKDLVFDEYPEESIAEWHERHGLTCD